MSASTGGAIRVILNTKTYDLAERLHTDENISNLSFLGFTFDGEELAGDADLRRKDTGVIRVSR